MVCDNLARIRETIARSARQAGRNPEAVKLVAVSKTVGTDSMLEAVQAGQILFGENYLQEAADKMTRLPALLQWHFIGHLQSNKAKQAAELFDVIETVDRWKVAAALDSHARLLGNPLSILLQVNIGREPQKSGVLPEQAELLLRKIVGETNLRVLGLMTMPPYSPDPEQSRPYFSALRQLAQRLASYDLFASNAEVELSMGMSSDYAVAIEEGATLVRVGTALFGQRQA
ncbi:MAG: YggS family pyridoxal phosphate-dependent enzyme [Desulfobulbus sp.]|uniref:YggS family pyridoxal phosphate-dependent enzyme n=1 Tax=Desulfobulbus sp. TaxID=895 RepID=UPI002843520D|nr:YggS family pyridoxal phosphate-dependent enzyme [Desulfobulbus sp.]MDR2550563.1 YggS family pyridoxal phosphate-dependent enzyme [Desulfobulbus sp.]